MPLLDGRAFFLSYGREGGFSGGFRKKELRSDCWVMARRRFVCLFADVGFGGVFEQTNYRLNISRGTTVIRRGGDRSPELGERNEKSHNNRSDDNLVNLSINHT